MTAAAFAPDGRRLATTHLYGRWRVRDAATGSVLKEMSGCRHFWSVAFSPTGWLLAVAGDNSVRVYDTASWQEIVRCDGHDSTVSNVFFGPDEGTLVSLSAEDGTALVWSLKPSSDRDRPDAARLWADLAGSGPTAFRAVWAAARHPDVAVRLFREKWPVREHPEDVQRLRGLIADLDSATFSKREKAAAQLRQLGWRAEPELRRAVKTSSPEVGRRIEALLARLAPPAAAEASPEDAREMRAVWALELAGTPDARRLLAGWASAHVGRRLAVEAAAALKRQERGRLPGDAQPGSTQAP
jgi:hypothetical protein